MNARILSGALTASTLQALLDGTRSYDRLDGWGTIFCPNQESREEAMLTLRAAGHEVEPAEVERPRRIRTMERGVPRPIVKIGPVETTSADRRPRPGGRA